MLLAFSGTAVETSKINKFCHAMSALKEYIDLNQTTKTTMLVT
jgi:hypothetical protein